MTRYYGVLRVDLSNWKRGNMSSGRSEFQALTALFEMHLQEGITYESAYAKACIDFERVHHLMTSITYDAFRKRRKRFLQMDKRPLHNKPTN